MIGSIGGEMVWLAGLGGISQCWWSGAPTDKELLQKSQGHYQEGVASLPGDRQKAFVSFQKSVQLNPENKEARYALGHVYALQGKLSNAEEQFRAAIKTDETFSEAHTYLGQVLANQDRWDEAIAVLPAGPGQPSVSNPGPCSIPSWSRACPSRRSSGLDGGVGRCRIGQPPERPAGHDPP